MNPERSGSLGDVEIRNLPCNLCVLVVTSLGKKEHSSVQLPNPPSWSLPLHPGEQTMTPLKKLVWDELNISNVK